MKTTNDGGWAFPMSGSNWDDSNGNPMGCNAQSGMSLRDWFAGMALQGFISTLDSADDFDHETARNASAWAYSFADAMIAKRENH